MTLRMDGSDIVTTRNYLGKATVKVESTSLSNVALDWAVAVCLDLDAAMSDIYPNGERAVVTYYGENEDGFVSGRSFCPSEHYSDGPVILATKGISAGPDQPGTWLAFKGPITEFSKSKAIAGRTMLEAGLRAYVLSEKGLTVRIPAQLLTETNATVVD